MTPEFWILSSAAFLTSVVSGTFGMGGGILLLVIMANYMPAMVLIPLHGIIQLASNTSRAFLNFKHLQRPIVLAYLGGSLVGALLSSQVVIQLPENIFKIIIAAFILIMTWLPKFKSVPKIRGKFFWIGGFATFISVIVGATGPLIAPFFLRHGLKKEQIVATKAGCQMFTHILKLAVYFSIGFTIGQYASLLVVMVGLVFLGTWCGRFLLHRVPEKGFQWIFRVLITLLAVRILLTQLI